MTLRETRTDRSEGKAGDDGRAAHLFVVLVCERPEGGGSRHRLEGVDVVTLCRGDQAGARRTVESGLRRLVLSLPDPWMSRTHAELVRVGKTFLVTDAGSKNGTRRNGELTTRAPLSDGDWIEVGHTFLRFRAEVEAAGGPADVVSSTQPPSVPGVVTLVPSFERELARVAAAARSSVPVVVRGASGSGKERIARAVHALSGRPGAFVAINCGALPEELVESELFGYRRGAFSGARDDHIGLVRAADGGTLFLDELGDLPVASQAAFLRVLQEGEVRPLGATRPVPVDLRVVSATHRDLARLVDDGDFRADLHARLAGVTVALPPLGDRREDIGLLVADFVAGRGAVRLTRDAASAMLGYDWPLNVRELEKCVAGALALTPPGQPIGVDVLPPEVRRAAMAAVEARPPAPELPLSARDRQHRDELVALLDQHGGNVAAVARVLGKGRFQIHRWVHRYAIDLGRYRR